MEGWERMASGNSEVSSGWRCKLRSHQVANEAELGEVRVDLDTVVVVVVGGSRLAKVHNFRSSR